MSKQTDIRWEQRFENYCKALSQLRKGIDIETPSDLEKEGIIQRFEYTFDLAWKTLKDYLEYQGHSDLTGSRDAFRQAFNLGLIEKGEIWMEMIESRNLTSHTYNEETAAEIFKTIKDDYFSLFCALKDRLKDEKEAR